MFVFCIKDASSNWRTDSVKEEGADNQNKRTWNNNGTYWRQLSSSSNSGLPEWCDDDVDQDVGTFDASGQFKSMKVSILFKVDLYYLAAVNKKYLFAVCCFVAITLKCHITTSLLVISCKFFQPTAFIRIPHLLLFAQNFSKHV